MPERPELSEIKDSRTFREYYYLKEELTAFCREKDLPASGSKAELTERIAYYLDTGKTQQPAKQSRPKPADIPELTRESIIEPDIVCSEKHRAFFKREIGAGFSFNVPFQKWLKSNAGKTYGDAITAYYGIIAAKKTGKTTIDKQFEYNTYIRDFFADNPGRLSRTQSGAGNTRRALKGITNTKAPTYQH